MRRLYMKLTWNNIKDVYLTKNGNLRHRERGILFEKESCVVCGEPFLGKEKETCCSKECSIVVVSEFHRGRKRSEETKRRLSEKAKQRDPSTRLKNSIDSIKEEIENEGYKLLSTEYVNNKTKLKMICPKGHLWEASYFNFQQGNRCYECSGKKKHEYVWIKNVIESIEGYTLLSTTYDGAFSKLKIKCPKGHVFYMRHNNFQQGQRCPECNKNFVTSRGEKEVLEVVKGLIKDSVVPNDKTQIVNPVTNRYLELDIWIPSLRKAIEYNGEYWHKKRVERDAIKVKQCEKCNIDLLTISDKEWKNNKTYWKTYIKEWLNESSKS
jgi:hypothetical protein